MNAIAPAFNSQQAPISLVSSFFPESPLTAWWRDAATQTFGDTSGFLPPDHNLGSFADITARLWPTYAEAAWQEVMGLSVPLMEPTPDFKIDDSIRSGKIPHIDVTTQRITPDCRMWNFTRHDSTAHTPRFLIVSPDSGSGSEAMTEFVHAFSWWGNVSLLQWVDPHYVPCGHDISLDSLTGAVVKAVAMNPKCHIVGDSQSGITAARAAFYTAQRPELREAAPASLTVISSPIDASRKPLASINWMATHSVGRPLAIPAGWAYPGRGRMILPGAIMKLMFKHAPDEPKTAFPVQALSDQFIGDTLEGVFRQFLLARGKDVYRGEVIDPAQYKGFVSVFMGARDKICTPRQTDALLDLTPNAAGHFSYTHPGGTHYGMLEYGVAAAIIAPSVAKAAGIARKPLMLVT
ncbi:MAG: hypothetical protein KGI37_07420 [Alphaproteobacteria bacterium]|nr:hypothetical protein [Alphaproteobacteria bacterium]